MKTFEDLIKEAEAQPFTGWDFSWLQGRWQEALPPWDFGEIVRRQLAGADGLLDLGTGGGEFLASLAPLPLHAFATESYTPNIQIAQERLAPLGVEVVPVEGAPGNINTRPREGLHTLPFPDDLFPLVVNRHESYYPAEVYRVLRPGGRFLTQQVGGQHYQNLNDLLGASLARGPREWTLDFLLWQVEQEGFQVREAREDFTQAVFTDVGAVAYYLKAVIWQIPDFSIERYRDRLHALHERIERDGPIHVRGHYFYLMAAKTGSQSRKT